MNTVTKYFFTAALAVTTFAACTSEGNEPDAPGRKECPDFTATIGDARSRAFDCQWEAGDIIGITGAGRVNVPYHTPDGLGSFAAKESGEQIYFQDDNEAAFTAYYPWNDLGENVTAISADTKAQRDQKTFDFLRAEAKGSKEAYEVTLDFSHMMAKVVLTVKPGTGMTLDEMKNAELSLSEFHHTGSFDTAGGALSLNDETEAWTFTDFGDFDTTPGRATFSFIFFPQVHAKPVDFLARFVLPGDKPLSLRAAIDFTAANREKDGDDARNEWVAGRQYNLNVTLNKTEISLTECVINDWTPVTGDDITVD